MMSDTAITQIATVLVALISLAGTLGVAYFQFRASRQSAKSKEMKEAEKRADDAKKSQKEAEDRLADELHKQELEAINDRITKTNERLTEIARGIKLISDRIEKLHVKMGGRTAELEEKVSQVVELLAKYAQTYSTIVRQYERTNRRITRLTDMEKTNLQYTIASVDAIEAIIPIIRGMHHHDEHSEEMLRLVSIEEQVHQVKKTFVDALTLASMSSVSAPIEQTQTTPEEIPVHPLHLSTSNTNHSGELESVMNEIAAGVRAVLEELETGDEGA